MTPNQNFDLKTNLSVLVHLVVGELDLLEGDDLLAKLFTGIRRIRVRIESSRWGRVSLSGHQPGGAVIGVAVPLVVAGDDVQEDPVLQVRPEICKTCPDCRKHPPAPQKEEKNRKIFYY